MTMVHEGPSHSLSLGRRPTLYPGASPGRRRKKLGLQLRNEQLVLWGDGWGMVREGFLEEVSFENGEEQGCAFWGPEMSCKNAPSCESTGSPRQ